MDEVSRLGPALLSALHPIKKKKIHFIFMPQNATLNLFILVIKRHNQTNQKHSIEIY